MAADRSAHTSDVPAPAAVPRRGFLGRLLAAFAGGALLGRARPAEAAVPAGDSSAFISEIRIFATGVVPPNWALCQGQLLPIASNTALFSLIGTFYGGNGVSTFALPDLRGRVPLQPGQGPGLSSYSLGEMGGVESVTLSLAQLPSHTHAARGSTGYGATDDPANGVVAREQAAIPEYAASADVDMAPAAITSAGSGQPHPNMQPYLAINYIICLQGIFPSHS